MIQKSKFPLIIAATVIGGFSLAVFSKISRDILFDGLSLCSSTSFEITLGSLALFASSLLAGFMASMIVIRDNYIPHILISAAILTKMSFVVVCGQLASQIWFDAGLGMALIIGLWFGHYAALKFPLASM